MDCFVASLLAMTGRGRVIPAAAAPTPRQTDPHPPRHYKRAARCACVRDAARHRTPSLASPSIRPAGIPPLKARLNICGARRCGSGTLTPMPRTPSAIRSVSICNALRYRRSAPFGQHFHADRRHLHRDEVVALAHVEAARVADVAEIGEIDRVLRAHVAAAGRNLLQRDAALMAFGDVEEGAAVRPKHPFIGREHHEIRIETLHVHRQHADALASRRSGTPRPAAAAPRRLCRHRSARRPTSAPTRSRRG